MTPRKRPVGYVKCFKCLENVHIGDCTLVETYDDRISDSDLLFILEEVFDGAYTWKKNTFICNKHIGQIEKQLLRKSGVEDELISIMMEHDYYERDYYTLVRNIIERKKKENEERMYNDVTVEKIIKVEVDLDNEPSCSSARISSKKTHIEIKKETDDNENTTCKEVTFLPNKVKVEEIVVEEEENENKPSCSYEDVLQDVKEEIDDIPEEVEFEDEIDEEENEPSTADSKNVICSMTSLITLVCYCHECKEFGIYQLKNEGMNTHISVECRVCWKTWTWSANPVEPEIVDELGEYHKTTLQKILDVLKIPDPGFCLTQNSIMPKYMLCSQKSLVNMARICCTCRRRSIFTIKEVGMALVMQINCAICPKIWEWKTSKSNDISIRYRSCFDVNSDFYMVSKKLFLTKQEVQNIFERFKLRMFPWKATPRKSNRTNADG